MAKLILFVALVAVSALVQIDAQGVTMTDSLRQLVLNAHNTLRSTVALGQAPNKNGTNLPKAADMYRLIYSKLVESYAQANANNCSFTHNYVNGTSNNLYIFGSTGGYADPGKLKEVVVIYLLL